MYQISIYHDIDLDDIAEEISNLRDKDITNFIKLILNKKEDFDFETDLIFKLFDNLELEELVFPGVKTFLEELREKIDIALKEMD